MKTPGSGRKVNPDSVHARMRRFFEENPEEELTWSICKTKFNASKSSIENALTALRREGLVESVHVIRNRQKGIGK